MFSLIGRGFHLVLHPASNSDSFCVAKRIAQSAWGLFEISVGDLVLLRQACEDDLPTPQLYSLRCLNVGRCRHALVK